MERVPMQATPIQFAPHYMERVWGGRRLETLFGRSLPVADHPFGESWELSDRPEAQSQVKGGPWVGRSLHDLWQNERVPIFGESLKDHPSPTFPLLMKILDASEDLSIQVHPPESVAAQLGGEPKTEMWFIAHAEPEAKLYVGLREGADRPSFEQALRDGTVADVVNVIEPKTGDCLFIPSGRLHAIGKGLVIFEIQQNSNTTYRVFDWNRVGLDGKARQLHIDESLQSIDFDDHDIEMAQPDAQGRLVTCPDFTVAQKSNASQLGTLGENLTVAVVQGQLTLSGTTFQAGDFFILPACMNDDARQVVPTPETTWLEIQIPSAPPSNPTASIIP